MNLRSSSLTAEPPPIIQRDIKRKIRNLLLKDSLTNEEKQVLEENAKVTNEIRKLRQKQVLVKTRSLEIEDDASIVIKQCHELADALARSRHAIVYTGAGISTAANIPDFRGTSGVWTKLNAGKCVKLQQSLTSATPTTAHMCLRALYDEGVIKHIVSQNCDGLHLRSGIPQRAISEVHGNMYIESCADCKKQVYRLFDVTKDTSLHRHKTARTCKTCGRQLHDTIVHFGERSNLRWPHNWEGAVQNAEGTDLILCLGSSLKVLRSYKQLWLMERRKDKRPLLYIVNLQWTPKDSQASMKIHGRIDFVMETVVKALDLSIPTYRREDDPIYDLAEPCEFDGQSLSVPHKFSQKFSSLKPGGDDGDGDQTPSHERSRLRRNNAQEFNPVDFPSLPVAERFCDKATINKKPANHAIKPEDPGTGIQSESGDRFDSRKLNLEPGLANDTNLNDLNRGDVMSTVSKRSDRIEMNLIGGETVSELKAMPEVLSVNPALDSKLAKQEVNSWESDPGPHPDNVSDPISNPLLPSKHADREDPFKEGLIIGVGAETCEGGGVPVPAWFGKGIRSRRYVPKKSRKRRKMMS